MNKLFGKAKHKYKSELHTFIKILIIIFISTYFYGCKVNESKEISIEDLSKYLPKEEQFAAEPLLVTFREKIETRNFQEFSNVITKNISDDKKRVIKLILDRLEPLNLLKGITGVYVEHSNNVTFSIVYFLFDNSRNAIEGIKYLEQLYTELVDQNFSVVDYPRKLGEDQKVLYTTYLNYPIYLALYRRENIVTLLFVPLRNVFPRIFPISSLNLPNGKEYYQYKGLPDFAKVEKPTIAELKVPTEDYYIPNTSTLRQLADERSKLWLEYFKKHESNIREVGKQFFALIDKKLFESVLAYVDLRNSERLLPHKLEEWYQSEIYSKLGGNLKAELIPNSYNQPRHTKVFYEGGVRYQYPKLGMCEAEFRVSGSKRTKKVKVTYSVFGNYLKIVDVKI